MTKLTLAISLTGDESIDLPSMSCVASQSRRGFEVICTGDDLHRYRELAAQNAPDDFEVPAEFESMQQAFFVLRSREIDVSFVECPRGASVERNEALAHATGDLIYFMDSKTRIQPRMLAFAIHRLEAADADVIAFHCRRFDSSTGRYVSVRYGSRIKRQIDSQLSLCADELGDSLFDHFDGHVEDKIFKVDLIRRVEGEFEADSHSEEDPFVLLLIANSKKLSIFNFALADRAFDRSAELESIDGAARLAQLEKAMSISSSIDKMDAGSFRKAYDRWLVSRCVDGFFDMTPEARSATMEFAKRNVAARIEADELHESEMKDWSELAVFNTITMEPDELYGHCLELSEAILQRDYEILCLKHIEAGPAANLPAEPVTGEPGAADGPRPEACEVKEKRRVFGRQR